MADTRSDAETTARFDDDGPDTTVAPVPCNICLREIPASAAAWRESSDYAEHFCGLACFERWRGRSGG